MCRTYYDEDFIKLEIDGEVVAVIGTQHNKTRLTISAKPSVQIRPPVGRDQIRPILKQLAKERENAKKI